MLLLMEDLGETGLPWCINSWEMGRRSNSHESYAEGLPELRSKAQATDGKIGCC